MQRISLLPLWTPHKLLCSSNSRFEAFSLLQGIKNFLVWVSDSCVSLQEAEKTITMIANADGEFVLHTELLLMHA